MKLFALVLAVSAALNVALVAAFVSQPALVPAGVRDFLNLGTDDPVPPPTSGSRARTAKPAAKRNPWARLSEESLPALVARLRAAGFPASVIRAIAEAEIQNRFSARVEELRRIMHETPYWRGDPGHFTGSSQIYEQMAQISRERARALRELLGTDAFAYAGADPTEAQRQRFGNLSPGKIQLVQQITDDYAEMTSQIRSSMQGITLPEDREKFALLEREKKADLAGILTPEELADYEMRTSTITMRLRTAFSIMDATEDEFRKIYAAHVPHTEVLFPTSTGGVMFMRSSTDDPRALATTAIHEELKRTLGPERFAQYQRANDRDFQQLYQITRAANTPYDTLVRAHEVRHGAAEGSTAIAADPALSPDQKRAALKTLADESRTKILSTLGPGAGPTYAEASRWLTYLEQGRPFAINPDGNISSRPIMAPRPAPSATKK